MTLFIIYYYDAEGDKDWESIVAENYEDAKLGWLKIHNEDFDDDRKMNDIISCYHTEESCDVNGQVYKIKLEAKQNGATS